MTKTFLIFALLVGGALNASAQSAVAEGYQSTIRVTPLLRTSRTAADQPIVYPRVDNPEVTAVRVVIPPGAETGWHRHPFPCYGYLLSGELTVEMEGGKTKRVVAGEALAESVDVLHNGRNAGPAPVELVMFVTGEKGEPFTVKTPAPK